MDIGLIFILVPIALGAFAGIRILNGAPRKRQSLLFIGLMMVPLIFSIINYLTGGGGGVIAFNAPIVASVLGLVALLLTLPKRTTAADATSDGAPSRLNVFAVFSLILAILIAPVGVVLGHIALAEIRRTGDRGRGLAIAGLVVGYTWTVGIIVLVVFGVLAR